MAFANLLVSLKANTKQFRNSLKSSKRDLAAFATDLKTIGIRAAKWGAALTTAAGAGVALLVRSQLKAIDETSKLSDQLGISTEALIGYNKAAGLSGVETAALHQSFKKLAIGIGQAQAESGAAFDALNALGLTAKELAAVGLDESLLRIADALGGISDPSKRASIAQALFGGRGGTSGIAMLSVLEKGRSGLIAFREEAAKTGESFTRSQGAMVEMANDAIRRIKDIAIGFGRQIAIGVAPVVDDLAQRIIDFRMEGEDAGTSVSRGFSKIADWVKKLLNGIDDLRAKLLLLHAESIDVFIRLQKGFDTVLGQAQKNVALQLGLMGAVLERLPGLGGAITRHFFRKATSILPTPTPTQDFTFLEDLRNELLNDAADLQRARQRGFGLGDRFADWFKDVMSRRPSTGRAPGRPPLALPDLVGALSKQQPSGREIALSRVSIPVSSAMNAPAKQTQKVKDEALLKEFQAFRQAMITTWRALAGLGN